MGGATSFRTVQRTALKDLSPIPAGLFVLGQTDTYRGALSIVNQREAFRPPLEETPDPRSRFAAIALIGVVCAGTTASPREVTSPIRLGVRSASDFGIGVGHAKART